MSLKRRHLVILVSLVLIAAIGGGAFVLMGKAPHRLTIHGTAEPEETTEAITVKVIRPKRDPALQVTVQQLASVEAFFQANLRARASGVVRAVHKDIGDRVRQGEVLIDIAVPDLEQDVAQRESIVAQRQQELRVAQANLKSALALQEVARATIQQRQTEVSAAQATTDLRRKRLERYRALATREAIGPDVVDEQERDFYAAQAAWEAARVAVQKAEADAKEKDASVEAARVDIDLKAVQIEVARKDLDRARAVADFGRVTAPFDGVITSRHVDPGTFVQNATSGQSDALASVARTDLITVVVRLPDHAAPLITRGTEATIELEDHAGPAIFGQVTRFSPSIQNNDRTMRVEIDLFNGSRAAYARFIARRLAGNFGVLAAADVLSVACLRTGHLVLSARHRKGVADALPACVNASEGETGPLLLPGMSGTARLRLGQMANAFVLPANAVYSRGGKQFVLLVRDGVTKQMPVRVQVQDGTIAKVAVLERINNREVVRELTGREEIVQGRQLELGDGLSVKVALADW
jgi:multidrug efflux pump subunit AcrA (membrane-fusion protein)